MQEVISDLFAIRDGKGGNSARKRETRPPLKRLRLQNVQNLAAGDLKDLRVLGLVGRNHRRVGCSMINATINHYLLH